MRIIATIKQNGNIKCIQLDPKYYNFTSELQFNVDKKSWLKNLGYESGTFQLGYYICQNDNIYNSTLKVSNVAQNKTQIITEFSSDIDDTIIIDKQEQFNQNIKQTKLLAYFQKKVCIVTDIKYNFFTEKYFLRFKDVSTFQKGDEFLLSKLIYEPIFQTFNLLSDESGYQELYVKIEPPHKLNRDYISTEVSDQNLESLLQNYTASLYNMPLSLANMKQTVFYDPEEPETFVHFGSYQSRLQMFRTKYLQLESISSSYSQPYQKMQDIISDFNTFQRYCITEPELISTSSLGLLSLTSSTSSDFLNWYQTKSNIAVAYDLENPHSLINLIPESMLTDERNTDLFAILRLMGDVFDQYWSAIKTIPTITSRLETDLQTYSEVFLRNLLNNWGIDTYYSFSDKFIQQIYLQFADVLDENFSYNQYNRTVLSRLLANIPFLLRTKGTRTAVQQLLNIFGFSENLLRINEFHKDGYTGSYTVDIVKPYYNTTLGNLTITCSNTDLNKSVILYCSFPEIITQSFISTLPDINYSYYDTESFYVIKFVVSGSQVNIFNYDDGIFGETQSITADLNNLDFANNLHVYNVKYLNIPETHSQDSVYNLGSNIVDNLANVQAIFDFNSFDYQVLPNDDIYITDIDTDAFSIGKFSSIKYSSIFALGNNPSKFYTISTNQSQQIIQGENSTDSFLSLPNVHIGSLYSDNYNSQFVIDQTEPFENLLDNNQYRDFQQFPSYWHTQLQKYSQLYDQYMYYGNTVSFQRMTKFYENMDNNVFLMIKQFVPFSVNAKYGLILENNILHRNRIPTIQYAKNKIEESVYRINKLKPENRFSVNYEQVPKGELEFQTNFQVQVYESYEANLGKTFDTINLYGESNYTADAWLRCYSSARIKETQATYRVIRVRVNTCLNPRFAYNFRIGLGYCETQSSLSERQMIVDEKQKLNITKIQI